MEDKVQFFGTLTKWNDEAGFGFITPFEGGQDVFVHISAFPRDGVRPSVGEWISYEVATTSEGKTAAREVRRSRSSGQVRVSPHGSSRSKPVSSVHILFWLLIAGLAIAAIYREVVSRRSSFSGSSFLSSFQGQDEGDEPLANESRFRCDGRIHCSQMKSCEEATYFLLKCPGVQMDGDLDGVPCERQWCS